MESTMCLLSFVAQLYNGYAQVLGVIEFGMFAQKWNGGITIGTKSVHIQ